MQPIRTLGKLHFEDLSPSRFEDLCLAMVYRLSRWSEIYHYGRKGNDDGIDIHAVEELENGNRRVWFIQCKRYMKITRSNLKTVVDEIIDREKVSPDILLLIVSCDVTKTNIEYLKVYSNSKDS